MTKFHRNTLLSAPLGAIIATVLGASPAAAQQVIVVPAGTTSTTPRTVGGTDSVTVGTGATLTSTANPTINWSTASTDLRITNSGTISSTASGGRAINASGAATTRTVTLTNNAGAVIESQDDAFRINVNVTSGAIVVNNAGIIRTTVGGQAIDFDAIAAGTASVTINNLAGGSILSTGQDAIRPGQAAVVNNAGTIRSDGAANNSYDGIDWQQRAGTVNNTATGIISGLRHGITSDVNVDVVNAGSITGRNGSGIGSDGTGTVVNTGTITGQWDGVAMNGDGDGVDIDFIGTVRNFGTIQGLTATGVDSGGRPNSAEGIAMGGGRIENATGATIFGGARGVLINHDTNAGGVADGATTIVNAGTIRGGTGAAIQFVGDFADTITNSGTITGGSAGLAIDMGGGNDRLNLTTGSVITGTVDGGAGTDLVSLGGTGGSFAGAVNVENLQVAAGNWTLTAASSFANGTEIVSGATLTGTTTTLTGAIANAGTLAINQSTAGTFGAALTGAGRLLTTGTGTITIASLPGFTGPTFVNAGRLNVTGTLASTVTVASGATLGGTGTVGATTIQSGGTIAPGLSIGTLNIAGNFVQSTGSTYAAETAAAGGSDRIAVTGTATIQNGATLALTRDAGAYTIGTSYTLLTATGGISGNYSIVTQAAAGNTEFRQRVTGTTLFADVVRSGAGLRLVAATRNQSNVANALATLGVGNGAYAVLTLIAGDGATRAGLDALSGEIHPSVRTAIAQDTLDAERTIAGRFDGARAEGTTIWGQFTGSKGVDKSDRDGLRGDRDMLGGFGGVERSLGDTALVGIGGGYTSTRLDLDMRASRARVKNYHVFGYAGTAMDGASLRGAIGYSTGDVRTDRAVAFAGFADRLTAKYDNQTIHGYAEAAYDLTSGTLTVQPFARLSVIDVRTDGFVESGGAAALTGARRHDGVVLSTAGLRASAMLGETIDLRGGIAWQHGYDTIRGETVLRFNSGTVPFEVGGTSLSRNAAMPSLTLGWTPGKQLRIAAGYAGTFGDQGHDHQGRVTVSFGF